MNIQQARKKYKKFSTFYTIFIYPVICPNVSLFITSLFILMKIKELRSILPILVESQQVEARF
jgi:hypothetical protein